MHGREPVTRDTAESEPGATYFNVFAGTLDTVHDPLFAPIQFEADIDGGTGRFSVPGVVEAMGEPIRNPITGQPHRAKLSLPNGFEFRDAEFASSTVRAQGHVSLDWANRHAHLAMINIGPSGPVR